MNQRAQERAMSDSELALRSTSYVGFGERYVGGGAGFRVGWGFWRVVFALSILNTSAGVPPRNGFGTGAKNPTPSRCRQFA